MNFKMEELIGIPDYENMAGHISSTFRSIKPRKCPISKPNKPKLSKLDSGSSQSSSSCVTATSSRLPSAESQWCVYLIASTNSPIKTYVGVTTDFPRRLKQHNGEIRGGAKASRAGRPWLCACVVRGFRDHSEACSFESKWKSFSMKLPRKKKDDDPEKMDDKGVHLLLQHRHAALEKMKHSCDFDHLEFDWQLDPS